MGEHQESASSKGNATRFGFLDKLMEKLELDDDKGPELELQLLMLLRNS